MRKISVCDFTLRELAAEGRDDILFREKMAIVSCINNYGADKIELPEIKRPKEDAVIYKTISTLVKDCTVAVPAGYSEESIDTAWNCISACAMPCLQIVLPVATAQMEYLFRAKEKTMLENIAKLVSYAKTKCDDVEFVALDATRADVDFLKAACAEAEKNGAASVTVCDDAGVSLPEEIAELVCAVKAAVTVPVSVCLSDHSNMAVACALYALKAGADGVKTSMTGKGVLLTERFARAQSAKGEALGFCTSLKLTELHSDIRDTVDHVIKNTKYPGAIADSDASGDVYLDAESTLADVSGAVRALGYELSDEDNGKVYKALMQVCEKKNSVGAKELEALIASNAMQVPSTYHLVSYVVNCTNLGSSMAQVNLESGDEKINGVATGDGPVDAAFRAIEQSIGYHYELDDFQVQTVTEGKESLGSATVMLRNEGKLFSGNGISTDIVGASIRAYINALNKIVYEED